jgi:hypothetical protein
VRMGRDVACALSYAHRHGILHRDIKPSNVLRTAAGRYQLVDFGAVGLLRPGTSATRAGEIAGTPLYMSVEQITGAPQTPASDLFGFGLLLYRCLHGHLPDEAADNFLQLLQSRMQTPIKVPPSPLRGLLVRCLALDPAQRPQSAEEVLTELRQLAQYAPPNLARPAPPGVGWSNSGPAAGVRSTSRRRSPLVLVGLVVGVSLVTLVVWMSVVLLGASPPTGVGPGGAEPGPRIGVDQGLSVGVGLAIVAVAFVVAQQVRRRWASRAPEAEQQAATILFGAGQRAELTQSLMIEVDQVVKNLNALDAKFLGMTVVAMVREYEEGRDSSERQAALLNVVALMEKLQARFSPWHIRHKEAIATGIAVVGSLVGVASVISGFLK